MRTGSITADCDCFNELAVEGYFVAFVYFCSISMQYNLCLIIVALYGMALY